MKGCRPLKDAEVALIARTFGGRYALRDKALFIVGVKTGFRVSELLSLRVRDVMQGAAVVERVTVRKAHMKKKTSERTMPLHQDARAALAEWLNVMQAEGWLSPESFVFRSRKGGNRAISRVQAWSLLHEAADSNELLGRGRIGTHSMRKTFANKVYDFLGHDIYRLKHAMGHRDIKATEAYLSFRESDIDAAVMAL